jgi:hypothetical protein
MAYEHINKNKGDLIQSNEWNNIGHELERLEKDKVNKTGDTIEGGLTVKGTVKANKIQLNAEDSAEIEEFSTDGNLTDNSDKAVPTEKAIKTYVNAQVSGIIENELQTTLAEMDNKVNKKGDAINGQLTVSGNFGIGTTTPVAELDVNGTVKASKIIGEKLIIPAKTSSIICNAENAGMICYDKENKKLQFCNGTNWENFPIPPS